MDSFPSESASLYRILTLVSYIFVALFVSPEHFKEYFEFSLVQRSDSQIFNRFVAELSRCCKFRSRRLVFFKVGFHSLPQLGDGQKLSLGTQKRVVVFLAADAVKLREQGIVYKIGLCVAAGGYYRKALSAMI